MNTILNTLYQKILFIQISFTFNDEYASGIEKIFGKIDFEFNNLMKNIKQNDYEIIDLDYQPTSFCTLPNETLVMAVNETSGYMTRNVNIYDKEFKSFKKIKRINNKTFSPRFVTSNAKNFIFITDNQIIKTDMDFNFVN